MEEFLLKSKHYQIFLSLTLPSILVGIIPNFGSNVQLIKIILITLPYIMWIFLLGRTLNLCVPARYRLNETMLIVNLFYFCAVFVFIVMFLDGRISFNGIAVIIPLYMIISFLYLFYFASKAITYTEQGRRTSFGENIGLTFILLLGYFGIWFIQPRVNAIWEKHKSDFIEETENENSDSKR